MSGTHKFKKIEKLTKDELRKILQYLAYLQLNSQGAIEDVYEQAFYETDNEWSMWMFHLAGGLDEALAIEGRPFGSRSIVTPIMETDR